MNTETEIASKVLWFAKISQFISAAILTPEIIGPDRFERLEKFIESQDFSKKSGAIFSVVVLAGLILSCPLSLMLGYASQQRYLQNTISPDLAQPLQISSALWNTILCGNYLDNVKLHKCSTITLSAPVPGGELTKQALCMTPPRRGLGAI